MKEEVEGMADFQSLRVTSCLIDWLLGALLQSFLQRD